MGSIFQMDILIWAVRCALKNNYNEFEFNKVSCRGDSARCGHSRSLKVIPCQSTRHIWLPISTQ